MKADGQILCDNVLTMLEILHKNMFLNDQSRSNVNIINDLHRSVRILPDLWSPEHVGLGTSRVGHSDVGRDERIVLFQRHFGKKETLITKLLSIIYGLLAIGLAFLCSSLGSLIQGPKL